MTHPFSEFLGHLAEVSVQAAIRRHREGLFRKLVIHRILLWLVTGCAIAAILIVLAFLWLHQWLGWPLPWGNLVWAVPCVVASAWTATRFDLYIRKLEWELLK